MRGRRLLLPIVAAVVTLVSAGSALAGTYPPPVAHGQGTADPSRVGVGECTTFSGGGYTGGTSLTITDNGAFVRTTKANKDGTFATKVCFNGNAMPGRHELQASGANDAGQTRIVTATVEVMGESVTGGSTQGGSVSGTSHSGLPFTGFVAVGLVTAGLALVLIGSTIVLIVEMRYRRRRRLRLPV